MQNRTLETIHRNGVAVQIDAFTGDIIETLDAVTGLPARIIHKASTIAEAVRFAQESILSLAELG
jgi:hypothetical protein